MDSYRSSTVTFPSSRIFYSTSSTFLPYLFPHLAIFHFDFIFSISFLPFTPFLCILSVSPTLSSCAFGLWWTDCTNGLLVSIPFALSLLVPSHLDSGSVIWQRMMTANMKQKRGLKMYLHIPPPFWDSCQFYDDACCWSAEDIREAHGGTFPFQQRSSLTSWPLANRPANSWHMNEPCWDQQSPNQINRTAKLIHRYLVRNTKWSCFKELHFGVICYTAILTNTFSIRDPIANTNSGYFYIK